jgi:hypothetical protein
VRKSNADHRLLRLARKVLRDVPISDELTVTPYTPGQWLATCARSGFEVHNGPVLPELCAEPTWGELLDCAWGIAPRGELSYWRTVAGQPIVTCELGGLMFTITPKRWRAPRPAELAL